MSFSTPAKSFLFSSNSPHLQLLNVLTVAFDLLHVVLLFLYIVFWWFLLYVFLYDFSSVALNEVKSIHSLSLSFFFCVCACVSQTNCMFNKVYFSKYLFCYFTFLLIAPSQEIKATCSWDKFYNMIFIVIIWLLSLLPPFFFCSFLICILSFSDQLHKNNCPFAYPQTLPLSVSLL